MSEIELREVCVCVCDGEVLASDKGCACLYHLVVSGVTEWFCTKV